MKSEEKRKNYSGKTDMHVRQGARAPSAQNKREYKIFLSRFKVKLLFHGINHLLNETRIFQPLFYGSVIQGEPSPPLDVKILHFPLQGIPIKCVRVLNVEFFPPLMCDLQDPSRTFGQRRRRSCGSSRNGNSPAWESPVFYIF